MMGRSDDERADFKCTKLLYEVRSVLGSDLHLHLFEDSDRSDFAQICNQSVFQGLYVPIFTQLASVKSELERLQILIVQY